MSPHPPTAFDSLSVQASSFLIVVESPGGSVISLRFSYFIATKDFASLSFQALSYRFSTSILFLKAGVLRSASDGTALFASFLLD